MYTMFSISIPQNSTYVEQLAHGKRKPASLMTIHEFRNHFLMAEIRDRVFPVSLAWCGKHRG